MDEEEKLNLIKDLAHGLLLRTQGNTSNRRRLSCNSLATDLVEALSSFDFSDCSSSTNGLIQHLVDCFFLDKEIVTAFMDSVKKGRDS